MKVTEYKSFDEFEQDESRYEYEHVAIVNKPNGTVCADLMTECKRWKTAVNRFFSAIANDPRFEGWKECIIESIENGYWSDKETYWNETTNKPEYRGGYFWEVEDNDGSFYICLNVAA